MKKKRIYYKGKRVSKGEKRIIDFLIANNIPFENEKIFNDCRGRNNRYPLRFDFFLESYNLLIEYDGQHHYRPVNKGWRAKRVHDRTKINDEIKNNYIVNKKLGLLRISYQEYDDIETILRKVLDECIEYQSISG
jgi:hypothetical protein